jgi:hypothetical protein
MSRIVLLGALMALAAPAVARAAPPPARPVTGVKLSWPLKAPETTLAPGTRLTVKVVSAKRRSEVSLVRVNAARRAVATIARLRLRSGTFRATVPSGDGLRYALRLKVAGRTYSSTILTPAAVPPPTVPPPPPSDPPPCVSPSMSLGLAPVSVTATRDTAFAVELQNLGAATLHIQGPWEWTQPERPTTTLAWSEPPDVVVAPGQRLLATAAVPPQLIPGVYSLERTARGLGLCPAAFDITRGAVTVTVM